MSNIKNDRIKIFDGRISLGLGAARGNLAAQLPKIALEYPAIKDCYFGSINIKLDQPLHIAKADHTTQPIEWMPGVLEKFSLTEVEFEYPIDGPRHTVWVYSAELSPHRFNKSRIEIIAPIIPGIAVGKLCRLYIPRFKGRVSLQKGS